MNKSVPQVFDISTEQAWLGRKKAARTACPTMETDC